MNRRNITIDDDTWDEAAKKAAGLKLSLSAVIRILLSMWLRGDIKLEVNP